VITTMQVLLFVGPITAYFVTKRICVALQRKDREIVLHGYESGRIVRLPGGEYIEVHNQIDDYERWRLVSYPDYQPLMVRPNASGRINPLEFIRAPLSRWFFEDRIEPVTSTELVQQHH
jgi:ubiquinol-cytochrome c reductase cytochrome b subunit